MIILNLVQNIALLMALVVVHQLFSRTGPGTWLRRRPVVAQILSGLVFGAFGVVGMLTPLRFAPGIIFDGRSIILSVAGLFGGPVVACIAGLMCGAYRYWLGGAGAAMGVAVITEACAFGVLFHHLRGRRPSLNGYLPLWGFGMLVHAVMLGCMFLLPRETRWQVIRGIGPAVLLVYPVATMVVCRLFIDQEQREQADKARRKSEAQYRELVELANSIILRWDRTGTITFCNDFGLRFFGYTRNELIGRNAVGTIVPKTDTAGRNLERMIHEIVTHPEKYEINQNENMRRDGSRVWVAWTNRPILNERGECSELLAVGVDITDRRRAEEALQEKSQLFAQFMEHSPIYAFIKQVTPTESRVLQASENFRDMIGIPGHEMMGKRMEDLFEAEFAEKITRDDWNVVTGGKVLKLDEELNGRYYTSIKFPIILEGKTLLAGYTIDITERRLAEEAVRLAHSRLQQFIDANIVGVIVASSTGKIIEANDYYLRLIGSSRQEYELGKVDWRSITPPEWISADERAIAELRETGKCQPYEKEYVRRDGTRVPVLLVDAMLPGPDERIAAFVLDLTERKKAEEQYRTLFREMLDGFALHEIICDADGKPVDYRYLAVNPAFERITGLHAESVVGHTVKEFLPSLEQEWIDVFGNVALTGNPAFFENFAAELAKEFKVTAFRPAPGQFACIFADITEQRRAEKERVRLETQLQQAQKMESIGRLAGGVAHDFNNMLGVILGYAEMALLQVDPKSPLHADLQEIRNAATRSADLTGQLLAFARRQTVSPEILDLNETVAGLLKMLRRLIGENVQLVWTPGHALWQVRMDPSQVNQILANLCVNARDAINDVGKITIGTENRTVDEAYCDAHPDGVPGQYVMLHVSDDGCGMDIETLSRIFEPFFTTKEIGRGTGLGLAMIYGIVRQNGGFIDVKSEVGKGASFMIFLPRHDGDDVASSREEAATRPVPGGQETILLVEDEPAFLRLSRNILERQGYRVLAAATPSEALRLAQQHAGEIRLLVTDVVMPEMNGADLARELQSRHPDLKCLFMSGYTDSAVNHQGEVRAGTHFIEKPFSTQELAAKVREVLDRAQ